MARFKFELFFLSISCFLLVINLSETAANNNTTTTTVVDLINVDEITVNLTDAQSNLYDRIKSSKYLINPYNLNISQSKSYYKIQKSKKKLKFPHCDTLNRHLNFF